MKKNVLFLLFIVFSLILCSCSESSTKTDSVPQGCVAVINGYEVSQPELEFRYRLQVQSFLSQYEQFISLFGIDTSSPFSEQQCSLDEEKTWAEFFTEAALDEIISTCYFNFEAEKLDNYNEILENAEEYASSQLISVSEFANNNEVEPETFIRENYGADMTFELFRKFVSRANIANECCTEMLNNIPVTEDDLTEYFNSNKEECEKNDYNTVSVRHILIVPESTGNIYFSDGTIDEASTSEASEKAYTAAEKKANAILEEITDKGLSAELFAEYAIRFSEDEGSASNGGLYENIEKGFFDDVFDAWCFASDRQAGDCEVIETEYGFDVMYLESFGEKYWQIEARSEIRSENYSALKKTLKEKYLVILNEDLISEFEKSK